MRYHAYLQIYKYTNVHIRNLEWFLYCCEASKTHYRLAIQLLKLKTIQKFIVGNKATKTISSHSRKVLIIIINSMATNLVGDATSYSVWGMCYVIQMLQKWQLTILKPEDSNSILHPKCWWLAHYRNMSITETAKWYRYTIV